MGDNGMLNLGLFPPSDSPQSRMEGGRLRMKQHPPFHNSAKRFDSEEASNGPTYHVAYRDLNQPERRTTKGWTAMDDSIKGARGTSTGKVHSSLAQRSQAPAPGSMLQPLYTTYPNETRLQELLDLQRRRLGQAPGPGQYDVAGWQPSKKCFRRQAIEQLDGPFVAPPDEQRQSTRDREMLQMLLLPNSGVSPGAYDMGPSKDFVKTAAKTTKIGTGDRTGRTQHIKSLSVSRSIQHGIDWHVPVVVQAAPAADDAAQQQGPAAQPGAATAAAAPAPAPGTPPGGSSGDGLLDADPVGFAGAGKGKPRTPQLPAPVGGKAPPPPAAVARTIGSGAKASPSNWDWQRLGHNYRTNWTTSHGGAYSQGDRTTARRDMQHPDAIDYMGSQMEGIDLSSLPPEEFGDIFPIPEDAQFNENDGHDNAEGYASRGLDRSMLNSAGDTGTPSMPSTAASGSRGSPMPGMAPPPGMLCETDSATGTPWAPAAQGEACGAQRGSGGLQQPEHVLPALLSQSEIARHEAAQAAALRAQQAAARRAAWNAKTGVVV